MTTVLFIIMAIFNIEVIKGTKIPIKNSILKIENELNWDTKMHVQGLLWQQNSLHMACPCTNTGHECTLTQYTCTCRLKCTSPFPHPGQWSDPGGDSGMPSLSLPDTRPVSPIETGIQVSRKLSWVVSQCNIHL